MLAVSFTEGIEDAWSDVASFVPKLVGALAILLVGWFIAKAIRKLVHRVLTRVGFDGLVDRFEEGEHPQMSSCIPLLGEVAERCAFLCTSSAQNAFFRH